MTIAPYLPAPRHCPKIVWSKTAGCILVLETEPATPAVQAARAIRRFMACAGTFAFHCALWFLAGIGWAHILGIV